MPWISARDRHLDRQGTQKEHEQVVDPAEVMPWRKVERQRLIGERLALNSDVRRRYANQIATSLEEVIGEVQWLALSR